MSLAKKLFVAALSGTATFVAIYPFERGLLEYVSKHITDSLHFPGFFVIAATCVFFRERHARSPRRMTPTELRVLVLTLMIASGLIEIVQPYTGRDASILDFLHSAAGALLGCSATMTLLSEGLRRAVMPLIFSAIWTIAAALPLLQSVAVYQRELQKFPALFSCDDDRGVTAAVAEPIVWERLRRRAPRPRFEPGPTCGIAVDSTEQGYSGMRYLAGGQDWSPYQELVLQIESNHEMELHLRIDDEKNRSKHSDRFNKTFSVTEGVNTIHIPMAEVRISVAGRTFNLQRIAFLYLFGDESAHPYTIRLRGAHLQ